MSRDEFLSAVRTAVRTGDPHRPHVRHDIPPQAGYAGAGADPLDRLATEIEAAGGSALIVPDDASAAVALGDLLDRYRPAGALCWRHPLLDRLGLRAVLAGRGIAAVDYEVAAASGADAWRDQALRADLGITGVTWAVAETGTLVMCSELGRERVASLLPPVHLAIIERKQILPDLFDLFQILCEDPQSLPSSAVFITGPSKTGDLELTLTTGVHGPGAIHAIVIE